MVLTHLTSRTLKSSWYKTVICKVDGQNQKTRFPLEKECSVLERDWSLETIKLSAKYILTARVYKQIHVHVDFA